MSLTGWIVAVFVIFILPSIRVIGPTQVGLVTKRFSFRKLTQDNPIAFHGEAGYQANLLMPGWRWAFWVIYKVDKYPWVQVPAGEIGVVIAQAGSPLPIGAKSAIFKPEFGDFGDLHKFIALGGQKGVQRPVLPPGTLVPIHPVGFVVITKRQVYGLPVSPEIKKRAMEAGGRLSPEAFGLQPEHLNLVRIGPAPRGPEGQVQDMVGIVTTYEGDPLPSGDIAGRLGGFDDVREMEVAGKTDAEVIEALLGTKNNLHNNYQDFQAFLDHGGKMGMQHDPLLYGAFALNPFLVSVELVPMLVVQQGEVAVVKAYVGLATQDISGSDFKFGSLVRPGHRGIWQEPLRTSKYAINPRCYQYEIVPTFILTLNWAATTSQAHNLDARLQTIEAKSREGFIFMIDLQVQIHVPDTKAPRVISSVGTMFNLVNEVLQAAVGNHFRDKLQSMPAVTFIETRQAVQEEAYKHIAEQLMQYQVETKGVYIQDVVLPEQLVAVLTQREIANQEIQTYQKQREAQDQRVAMEQAKGTADMQAQLAQAKVNVDIQTNNADARKAQADGESTYIRQTGAAQGAQVEAVGLARATAFKEQVAALGAESTALVNAVTVLAERGLKFVPEILVMGGEGGSGSMDGLAATLMRYLGGSGASSKPSGAALTPPAPAAAALPHPVAKPAATMPDKPQDAMPAAPAAAMPAPAPKASPTPPPPAAKEEPPAKG
ncbi:MAG TPA: SPFH domain-containing protein [Armatimonadota bacterium]|jgi:regulator of protease activity HflC (stomatin/prohibitin superfamily)